MNNVINNKVSIEEKEKAYMELGKIIRAVPELDYEKELDEYRRGKYEI